MRLLRPAQRHWPLLVPVALSTVLSSWGLAAIGWGNSYYSAAVRSMSTSWHAFWYGSLDSVGFVTVDKPPVSMQVQALVVRVFGFHEMSLLVPQVVAGVLAVVLVYATVVRRWGRIGATAAALALAVTPIAVMVNHSNNTDAILTALMTATVWAGVRAAEMRRWPWIVATGVLFGLSFTTKMLAAAPVLPAVLLAFAVAAPATATSWRRRLVGLAAMGALAGASALAWFIFVDLTPASERPYVGSSATNSAFQLAFDRNGVNQVVGDDPTSPGPTGSGAPVPADPPPGGQQGGGQPPLGPPPGGGQPPLGPPPGGGQGGGQGGPGQLRGFAGGEPGVLRLFNRDLGGQLGWLVVPGLAGAIGAALVTGRRRWWREPTLVAPLVWFAIGAGAYSITEGIVHPYYLASIAPALALLVGAGTGAARQTWQQPRTHLALGITIVLSGIVGWLLARRDDWAPAVVTTLAVTSVGLAVTATAVAVRRPWPRWLLALGAATLLTAPAVWTIGSLRAGIDANLPYADPTASATRRPGGAPMQLDTAVIDLLTADRGDADWLVAVPSARVAAPIIISTGEPVMALGGFSGADEVLTVAEFDALVDAGRVRYVLLDGTGPGGGGPIGQPGRVDGVITHISTTCAPVDEVDAALFDCSG